MASVKTPAKKATKKEEKCTTMKALLKNATNKLELFEAYSDRIWINERQNPDPKKGNLAAMCLSTHQVVVNHKIVDIGKIQPSTIYNVQKQTNRLLSSDEESGEEAHATLIIQNDMTYIQAKKGYCFHAVGHQTPNGFYNVDSFKVEKIQED